MSIVAADFSSLVVIPALQLLAAVGIPDTKTAHDLLMGTAAQESLLGTYLQQENGPGISPFMLTPSEVPSVLSRCSVAIYTALIKVGNPLNDGALATNLTLAAMVARCWYWIEPTALPPDTMSGLWSYYKAYYNSSLGAATQSQWNTNWKLTGINIPAN